MSGKKRGGRGETEEILLRAERLQRAGWPRESAIKAASFAVSGRRGRGRGVPSLEERTAFDMPAERFRGGGKGPPLLRWARAVLGGRGGEVAVRVPESPQETNYTCGPAALRGALAAFGVGAEEDALAAAAQTSASGGTSIIGLAEAAREQGLEAEEVEGMTLDDLVACLDDGRVVVACIQSGDDEEGFDSSHWVVPCAVRDEAGVLVVECMDPAVEGARSVAPVDEFLARWHCVDMGERVEGLGLVLTGAEPAVMTAIAQPATPL